jgi:polar amino acid transport system substrate-binding protein
MMPRRLAVVMVGVVCLAAACASEPSRDAATKAALGSLRSVDEASTASTTTTSTPKAVPCDDKHPARSLRPVGPLPSPGNMPAGSYMQEIQKRGALRVGVDQNTLGFGYRTTDGNIEGFDIDLLREVARSIFGSKFAIQLRAVTSAQRVPAITNNEVDIVASVMSITCPRWQQVDFSTEYYAASQRVLVRADSPLRRVTDLNGRKVCATRGSTSIDQIHKFAPRARLYPVDLRTECLVALQEGLADAISTDDTILYGLAFQDPNVRLLRGDLHQPERYGMAINQSHPDFVRFVNAVLEAIRADGRWTEFHHKLERRFGIPATTPPPAEYKS